jgi:CheY-like chemotaxis protein
VSVSAADARRLSVEPGDYVALSVADTGVGIDDRTRMHLFEPFFTTKEDRTPGAGMGLATVYGIVKQSGGHIAVDSDVGVGTTFSIFLLPSGDAEEPEAGTPSRTRAAHGERTVLLVEDDTAVRAFVSQVLQRRGYHVIAADGCAQALSLATRHDDPIDAVVTDIEMPGTTGIALTDRLREVLGPVPVLFITGYADEAAMPAGAISNSAFLRKPFTPDALARKVRTVIKPTRDARASTPARAIMPHAVS